MIMGYRSRGSCEPAGIMENRGQFKIPFSVISVHPLRGHYSGGFPGGALVESPLEWWGFG